MDGSEVCEKILGFLHAACEQNKLKRYRLSMFLPKMAKKKYFALALDLMASLLMVEALRGVDL